MTEFFKSLLSLIPIVEKLQLAGIGEQASIALEKSLHILLTLLLAYVFKKLHIHYKNNRTAKNLHPQFDKTSISLATQYYIPTKYQNVSPTRQEEPGFTHQYIAKEKLIPFFLKNVFVKEKPGQRFYLILADSGMGKTTFMVNLYMKYILFWNIRRRKGKKIKLFRLGYPDTLELVKEINKEQAKNTILLLDALDEDPNILPKSSSVSEKEAFCNRVDEIIETTKNFREVVLTCRTQYFPGQEDDPYELKVKRPDEQGYYILNKLYISPFEDKEIKQYLNKKFPFWCLLRLDKKRRSARIAKKTPKLIVRPMLLSYIDLLTEDKKPYKTVYSIYENLIEKWLEREAKKRKPIKERKEFIINLRELSQHTALSIYDRHKQNQGLFLSKEQAVEIAKGHKIELKPDEVTGKSLLTCDAQANWKFAHKSILEFFLVKHAFENIGFLSDIAENNFWNMDMLKIFCLEVLGDWDWISVKGGAFERKTNDGMQNVMVSSFLIGKYPVTQKLWQEIMGKNPSCFKMHNYPVEQVSWYDAIQFCNKLSIKQGFQPYYNIIGKGLVEPNETAKGFRLPTEAEWEFAARGGVKTRHALSQFKYAGSNNINDVAWYNRNSKNTTHPVGEKIANELGIYDMSGNVWEWCWDWYGEYGKGDLGNPRGPEIGSRRVLRGGSWRDDAGRCAVSYRVYDEADNRYDLIGFRLALSL